MVGLGPGTGGGLAAAASVARLQVGEHRRAVALVISHPGIVVHPRRNTQEDGTGLELVGLLARHRHGHTCRQVGAAGGRRVAASAGCWIGAGQSAAHERYYRRLCPASPICRLHRGADTAAATHPCQAGRGSCLRGCYDA